MSEAVKNNPKIGKDKNFFVMTGLIPYAPNRLTTTAKKKPFVSMLLEQTREAGADYKEFKRYFQILVFDEKIVDYLTTLSQQVKVEVTGNITIKAEQLGKRRVSYNKLIALDVKVIEETGEAFRAKKSESVANKTEEERQVLDYKPVAKPSNQPVLVKDEDQDLPF
jgi:ribosomal protein S10